MEAGRHSRLVTAKLREESEILAPLPSPSLVAGSKSRSRRSRSAFWQTSVPHASSEKERGEREGGWMEGSSTSDEQHPSIILLTHSTGNFSYSDSPAGDGVDLPFLSLPIHKKTQLDATRRHEVHGNSRGIAEQADLSIRKEHRGKDDKKTKRS